MRPADVAVLLLGIAAIVLALIDVFQSVIVPRAATVTYRMSFAVARSLWALWPHAANLLYGRNADRRENFFATFAPLALVVTLGVWVVVLVLGYGAILWALRVQITPFPHSYWDTVYFAGSSLLTIGFGDIVARHGLARFVSLCAGVSGLGVVSITTAYLFAIFGTFQQRETFIVTIAARAGSPPSGVGLLEFALTTSTHESFPSIMREGQRWIASLMESHLAYPILAYFRSSHDDQSWVATLGVLLDASALATTAFDPPKLGEAAVSSMIGRHAVHDLSSYFHLLGNVADPGIGRDEFDRAYERLASVGYRLRNRDVAWTDFAELRSEYAGPLNAMARFFQIPPVQWIGDRSLLVSHQHAAQNP